VRLTPLQPEGKEEERSIYSSCQLFVGVSELSCRPLRQVLDTIYCVCIVKLWMTVFCGIYYCG